MSEAPAPEELKRRARAAWAYSGKNQRELAAASGINYETLRGLLAVSGASPTADQAWKIATASEVPWTFVNDGWAATDAADERLAALEATQRKMEARLAVLEAEALARSEGTGHASKDHPR